MTVKVFTIGHLPESLMQEWLQHLRNFDVAHPGCHFEVAVDAPMLSIDEMVEACLVDPQLTFTDVIRRGR